ncbi:type II secretion system F family protein [Streptomyces antibioticus]|uniref:type II secretion system F family protein n=1 Tax=Streptomyces antibioticus TaxID=1890 RepID=UPI003D722F60
MSWTGEIPMAAAVACAGAAAWMLGGPYPGGRRAQLLLAGGGVVGVGPPAWPEPARMMRWLRDRWRPEWWAPVVGLALAVLGASVLPVLAGAVGVPLVRRALRATEARRDGERRGDAVIALCAALAGEVRAGRQPGEALQRAARDTGGLGEAQAAVLAAARFGEDVPQALATAARRPGAEGLLGLAACWRVAVDRGAGLAAGLDRLEAALRAERDQRADLSAQLAGPRATAVLLAGLPAVGLLLGTALGADPLHVLLHTGLGLACLAVGGALEAAGVWWVLWIVRKAEGRDGRDGRGERGGRGGPEGRAGPAATARVGRATAGRVTPRWVS